MKLTPQEAIQLVKSLRYNFRRLPSIADIRAEVREMRGGSIMPMPPPREPEPEPPSKEEAEEAFKAAMARYREKFPDVDERVPRMGETTEQRIERVRRRLRARLGEADLTQAVDGDKVSG